MIAGLAVVGGALVIAAVGLFGRPLREAMPGSLTAPARASVRRVRRLHSGRIGDYIAWWTAGAGSLGAVCLLTLK